MCKVQMLRALVKQRLTAAAEEIFGLFERTIAEYEEQLCRSKEENERQRKLLDAVYNPQLRLHRAEVQQQLLVVQEEVPPEQQEWSSSVDQEDPEPPHIKEEEEEPEVPTDSDPDLQPDNEDKNGVSSEPDTDDSGDWDETREPQSDFNSLKSDELSVGDSRRRLCEKRFSCSDCRKRFGRKTHLQEHMITHTGEKPFSCSECGRKFTRKACLKTNEDTQERNNLVAPSVRNVLLRVEAYKNTRTHTGEKPFSCSICKRLFAWSECLQRHMRTHTGERPFSCSECGKTFGRNTYLKIHMITHTGEKRFRCRVCDQRYTRYYQLRIHRCVGSQSSQLPQNEENREPQSGEKLFSCSKCGKGFGLNESLKRHMRSHTGEKPFTCSLCKKSFTQSGHLRKHMKVHMGCSECGRRFGVCGNPKGHSGTQTGEKQFNRCVCGRFLFKESDQTKFYFTCQVKFPWHPTRIHPWSSFFFHF